MTRRSGLSVRVRLALLNVGVLTLALVILGIVLRGVVRANLIKTIDGELLRGTERFARRWTDWSRDGNRDGNRDRNRNGNRDGNRNRDQGPGRPPQRKAEPTPPPPPGQNNTNERERFLGPRALNRYGKPFRDDWKFAAYSETPIAKVMQGSPDLRIITFEEEPFRLLTYPLKDKDGKIEGVVQMPFRLTDIYRSFAVLDATLLTLLPLAILVAGAGGALLTDRALRPVRDITQATDTIAGENLSGRLPVIGNDEFAELANRLNGMLTRLEEAFERQKRFTGDASHELRTPLAIIKANASFALDDETPTVTSLRRALSAIDGAADRTERIVQDLLFLARSDSGQLPLELRPISVLDVVVEAAREVEHAREGNKTAGAMIVLPSFETPDVRVLGDAHHLTRAVRNLLENAIRHTPAAGSVILSVSEVGNQVEIGVQDTGEGIAPEHLPHLYERFYRVDAGRARTHGGTGLGLAIVQSILEAHNGSVNIESEVGKGTTVTLTLPT